MYSPPTWIRVTTPYMYTPRPLRVVMSSGYQFMLYLDFLWSCLPNKEPNIMQKAAYFKGWQHHFWQVVLDSDWLISCRIAWVSQRQEPCSLLNCIKMTAWSWCLYYGHVCPRWGWRIWLTTCTVASYADFLLARHALLPQGEERLRDKPKESLRRRLHVQWICSMQSPNWERARYYCVHVQNYTSGSDVNCTYMWLFPKNTFLPFSAFYSILIQGCILWTCTRMGRFTFCSRLEHGRIHGREDKVQLFICRERCGGLMVSALDSGLSGPDFSPGWDHCVVFLGKTLNSHSASLHPGEYKWVPVTKCWRVTYSGLASHPGGVAIPLVGFMLKLQCGPVWPEYGITLPIKLCYSIQFKKKI